jgi:tetratricopeptide (TPR) repeat protein
MPLKPEIFHGRDDFVEEIARLLLQEETSRICILGPGGMGKTSVSLAVVECPLIKKQFPGGNCVWVPCIEATSATLLLEILYIQLQVPGDGDKQVTLEKIVSELDASKQRRLILLDNFETPWNAPGESQQVSDILRKLVMLSHVAILITMRGTYPPCDTIEWQSHIIQPTDQAACRRIFHDINPSSKDDPDVDCLLAALGHMPFAVTLMANLGKRGKSTGKELLETWNKSGTDMLSVTNPPEKSMNRSISLSVDSDFVKRNPDALLLLAILSLLPAGTTKQNLQCWWATTVGIIPTAIATLSDAGLLVENKRENSTSSVLFVIPVVQSYMQQQNRITEEIRRQIHSSCCEYILAHACRFDDPTFPKKSKALAAEDTNIQSILFSSPTESHHAAQTMEALIAFSWHRCDTKPKLEIANHAVTAAKDSGDERYIGLAVWCLGKTYLELGDYCTAYDHLHKAYQIFNTLPSCEVELQRLGGLCGIDLVDAARLALLPDISQAISLARDVKEKCATLSDDLVHGRGLVVLGIALCRTQQEEALCYLDQARTMLKAVGNIYNLAEAYQAISWVHYHEGRLPEALDAIEEAWKYVELTDSPSLQATVSLTLCKVLFSADRDTEGRNYIEIALMKASHTGDRLAIARALEYLGYAHLRRGDYQHAYEAYEAAAEKYPGTVDAVYADRRCKDNMARIKQKQRNIDMVIGFYRPGLDIDGTLFYPRVRVTCPFQVLRYIQFLILRIFFF